jgi:dipeptidyl aminopeptidase/acylaminoacyl peptidase
MNPIFPRALCLCALSLVLSAAGAAPRHLELDDFDRILAVEAPACARDGSWIAYTVDGADRDGDERRSAVWMVNWDGTRNVRLTSATESASDPRFSPDGRYVSFLSARGTEGHAQIYLLDRLGGEAQALTSTTGDIADYDWSPDGTRLVVAIAPGEGPPDPAAHGAVHPPKPIVIDRLHFKQDRKGYVTGADRAQLFLLDVATRKLEPLTADLRFDDSAPVWSPDGKSIAFLSTRDSDPDRSGMLELYVIDARPGAAARKLAAFFAPNHPSVLWTRDGKRIVYTAGLEPRLNAYIQDRLAVVPLDGGAPRVLTERLDRAVAAPILTADDAAVGVIVEDDRAELPAAVRLDPAPGRPDVQPLLAGARVVTAQCSGGGHTALVAATDHAAPELYALEGGALRKLTGHNDALMRELELGAVEDIEFPSRDGTSIHGLIVKPPGFQAGHAYPTLLWIHGGPNGQDAHGLDFSTYALALERQWFAAHGYVVLAVNYRGSSGRGLRFASAIADDWGVKEVADLLAGVDYAVRAGIADPDRLGLGGWSYGGILTDYTIASDTRFKAAISGAGSANQISMYGVDQYILQYNAEIGPPWLATERWLALSYPFFHADRIKTPTLFLGGDKDFNVPVVGGEQMYEALRTLGVPTALVIYPGQFHGLTRPSFIRDRLQRYLAWFDRYLAPAPR